MDHAATDAVIFDFDGVLVDSEPLHYWAFNRALEPLGWSVARDDFDARMVGTGDEACFALLGSWHDRRPSADEIDALVRAKTDAMGEGIREGRFTVQPGARELLAALDGRLPLGVCSGSRRPVVAGMLKHAELDRFFGVVVTHEDVARPKPDPEGYRLAARRLGVDPARCVVIEDSETGVEAATASGAHVIAVEHSMGPERLARAHRVVRDIASLAPDDLLRPAGQRSASSRSSSQSQ